MSGTAQNDEIDRRRFPHGYAYDRVGNITAITDNRPSDGTPSAEGEYQYDAYNRLIGADLDRGTAHAESLSYGVVPPALRPPRSCGV